MRSFRRGVVRVVGVVGVVAGVGLGVSGLSPVFADAGSDSGTVLVGSFNVDGASVGVDERTGAVSAGFPVGKLNGLGGVGAVALSLSYQSEHVGGGDVSGLGAGWGFGVTRVDVSGGVPRVFPAAGGVFEASSETRSGLARYPQQDLVFRQEAGALDVDGQRVTYGFVLETLGGEREFFSPQGFLVARSDGFENVSRWVWNENTGQLVSIVDAAGSVLDLTWTDGGVRVQAPVRADDVALPAVEITVGEQGVVGVTGETGESTIMTYDANGLVSEVRSPAGAVTSVTYRDSVAGRVLADTVVVRDATGQELSRRSWSPIGDSLFTGVPVYAGGEAELWGSGDGAFRYRTQVSDGPTSVVSTYNSMGLLVERETRVSTPSETKTVREERLTYPGTAAGSVPARDAVPAQYALPVETTTVFRDGDRSRSVTETSEFDALGRVVSQRDSLDAVTTTTYDETASVATGLPWGLVTEQVTTGVDGLVSKTVNTLAADHKSIAVTETFTGMGSDLSSVKRTSFVTDPDGFVSQKTESVAPEADVAAGPTEIVTRYDRQVDRSVNTVTTTEITGVETGAPVSVSTVRDVSTGLAMRSVDAVGRVSTFAYDELGRVASVIDPVGRVTRTEYENHGLKTKVTAQDGAVSSTYRDVLGRVVKTTNNITEGPDGGPIVSGDPEFERVTESRVYEGNGSRVTVIDALGRPTVSTTDAFGRPVSGQAGEGVTQLSVYDDVENTVTSGVTATPERGLAGALQTSTRVLDDAGRQTSVSGERADGVRVPGGSTQFDGLGRVKESLSNDRVSSSVLNADGTARETTTTPMNEDAFHGQSVTATRTHDMTGRSTNKTLSSEDGDNAAGITRVVDSWGRTVSQTDQVGGVTRFAYSPDGLVLQSLEEASGTVTRNTYDAVTRALVESVTSRGGVEEHRGFEYEPVAGRLVAVFDPTDRESTEVRYAYDVLGNQTSVSYPDGSRVSSSFDVNGRKIEAKDVAGNVTRYDYDELGLLESAAQTAPSGELLARVSYGHDVWGRTESVTRDNGVVTGYTFTSADEIASETTTNERGHTIFEGAYVYDAHGNLARKTVTGQHADATELATETSVYSYNAYDQLVASQVFLNADGSGAPFSETTYDVDVAGNVTTETVKTGGATVVRELEYNALRQPIAIVTDGVRVEQEWDAAGNLTRSAEGDRYVYDAFDRQISHTTSDGNTTESDYWATGKRKTQSSASGVTSFYWDSDVLTNERYDDETASSYLLGANRAARAVGGDVNYYVADRHGSVAALVNEAGKVTSSYGYTDYGKTTTHGDSSVSDSNGLRSNRFQYSGEYTNPDSSQLLGARVFTPESFGFTTRDSAPLYNLYAYGNANPITHIDPSGNTAVADWFASSGYATITGTAVSILGMATSLTGWAGWGTFAVATFAGLFDVGVGVAQIANGELGFMTEKSSAIWGWTAMGVGVGLGLAAGVTTLAAPRIRGNLNKVDLTPYTSPTVPKRGEGAPRVGEATGLEGDPRPPAVRYKEEREAWTRERDAKKKAAEDEWNENNLRYGLYKGTKALSADGRGNLYVLSGVTNSLYKGDPSIFTAEQISWPQIITHHGKSGTVTTSFEVTYDFRSGTHTYSSSVETADKSYPNRGSRDYWEDSDPGSVSELVESDTF